MKQSVCPNGGCSGAGGLDIILRSIKGRQDPGNVSLYQTSIECSIIKMGLAHIVDAAAQRLVNHFLQSLLVSLTFAFVVYIVGNEVVRSNARVRNLGGPKGLPLIGNIWDIRTNAATKYQRWAKQHGDVYQVQLGNVPVVIVNSAVAAKNLFISHSQALSSRPQTYTFHKVSHPPNDMLYIQYIHSFEAK
jgi:hypothetical protein